jgi:hypothetical protein
MSFGKLALAGAAALCCMTAFKPEPASAASLTAGLMLRGGLPATLEDGRPLAFVHFRRSNSYYCYPRNYWWFYRPYTTAEEGNARCMPYFHYPPVSYNRPATPSGRLK